MTDYQIVNPVVKQIQDQFKAGNGLNSASMRLLLAEFIRLEIAYLGTENTHLEKIIELQADNTRLAEQVGKLMAELERAQAGDAAEDSDGHFIEAAVKVLQETGEY